MATKLKHKKVSKPKKQDRLEEYFESIDFRTWWDSFANDINENGTMKYKTVWSFITAKTKETWKRNFLYWILGPKGKSTEYVKYQQFDWEDKREKGYWFNSTTADKLEKDLRSKATALAAIKEVGTINVSFIQRLEALCKEIDREYSGRLFLPNLSAKENQLRLNAYTRALEQVQTMMNQAQIMFGKSQGIDIDQLSQFLAMMFGKGSANIDNGTNTAAASMGFIDGETVKHTATPASKAMSQIMQMVMAKAAQRELDLPDPEMVTIIEEHMKPALVQKTK